MKIKKIVMRSFGKFQNKTFEFEDGLNLIYGDNEAGKSTIHHFIEGMLYGFYKSNIKNKRTTDEYDTYLPWDNSSDYSGVMIIEDDGRLIRIERNFMKNHDEVRIFDDMTGEEMTQTYDYDQVTKLYEPGLKHVGLNQNTFRNTVSVEQLGSKTGDELIMEIKNNLMNYGETNTMDVSLSNIMKEINEKKAKIGTARSKKSEYGQIGEQIEALDAEKMEAMGVYEDIKSLQMDYHDKAGELHELEEKKQLIEKSMVKFKDSAFAQNFQEALRIQDEIRELDDKLEGLRIYMAVSKERLTESMTKANNIDVLKREHAMQMERIEEINQTIQQYKQEISAMEEESVEIGTSEKIIRDVYKYEEFENQRSIIEERMNPEKAEEYKKAYDAANKTRKSSKSAFVGLLILFIIIALVKGVEYAKPFLMDNLSFLQELGSTFDDIHDILTQFTFVTLGLAVVVLVLMIVVGIRRKRKTIECEEIANQIEKEEKEIEVAKTRLADLDTKQKVLLDKHGCEDIVAMRTLKDQKAQEELFYTENFKRAAKLEEDIDALSNKAISERGRAEDKLKQIREAEEALSVVMDLVGITNYSGFSEVMDRQYEYQRIEQEKSGKQEVLNQLTKGEAFEGISLEPSEAYDVEDQVTLDMSYEDLEVQLKDINDAIVQCNKELSGIETRILDEENAVRPLVEIEDEIGRKQQRLEYLDFKLASYGLLEEAFSELTEKNSTSFAPSLNETVSKMIAVATDYKYTEVKVNPNMEITIVDNDSNKMVKVEQLSAGTIDLMYFALRLGLADLINEERVIPMFLDDCFVLYDDRRLVKVLELLTTIDRQVLLFTCHNREKRLLDRMTADVSIQSL